MKNLILLFAMATFISCGSSSESTTEDTTDSGKSTQDTMSIQPLTGEGDVAQQDTLKPNNVVPLDPDAAKKTALGSWTDPNITPANCEGCYDANGNEYAVGYEGCFTDRKLRCEGVKAGSSADCYAESHWTYAGNCK